MPEWEKGNHAMTTTAERPTTATALRPLEGRVALITGSSSGIGLGSSLRLEFRCSGLACIFVTNIKHYVLD